ncbi:hypothetical protein [Ideonella sp. YS5]|uniref:hypothetical protein n=1 Tax=Ideonella sp. YS5 TaxID=3453714 RepID=UPI003EECCA17
MPISLVNVDDLQEHLFGVLRRSDHHAGDVNEVLLTLSGAILWRKSPQDPVKVNTKEGAGGNVIWFRVDGMRYVLLYNHELRRIELAEGGRKGELIHTFTNETSTAEVVRIFAGLGEGVDELSKSRKVRKEDRETSDARSPVERQRLKAERLQAKQAKADARDDKVRARREERRTARATEKAAARSAAAEPVVEVPPPIVEPAPVAAPARRRRTAKPAQPQAALN